MRLIIVAILSIVFVCGCTNRIDVHEMIRVKFPNAEIANLPSSNNFGEYVIRSSNEVWYAEQYGEGYIKYTKIFSAKPE